MKGIRIDFDAAGGATLNFEKPVEAFASSVQNGMVNLGQKKGSSHAFPDKGTDLVGAGLRGLLINSVEASHYSNFAALDTVFFSRQYEPDVDNDYVIADVRLNATEFDGARLKLQAQLESNAGEQVGVLTEI